MRDVMLDIETLGTDSNSVVISISAVNFDLTTGESGKTFEVRLDTMEQVLTGGIVDSNTAAWWFSQDAEAISALLKIEKVSVIKGLISFNSWLDSLVFPNKEIKLWGNGSSFDNLLVRNLYKRHEIDFTLPYWCDNDVRTLVTLSNIDTRDFHFEGIKHKGIDDCLHQIRYCHIGYKEL